MANENNLNIFNNLLKEENIIYNNELNDELHDDLCLIDGLRLENNYITDSEMIPIINNQDINLHKHYKNMNISDDNNDKNNWLDTNINKIKNKNKKILFTLVEKIYNEGYSCIDLMNWYNNNRNFIDIDKARINILFEKIKSEYKSEKMLMMFIFDFIYLRSDNDLNCITTI